MRLLLIRHGQTPANVLGQLDTERPGPGLTELGLRQAAGIPDALQDERIDAIFASVLVRTQVTARPLAERREMEVGILGGLHEIEAGDLEKRSDTEAVRIYLETAFAWGAGDLDVAMPGGPDGHEFFGRYDADIAAIEASGARGAVAVSHGAAIRVWVAARAQNLPPTFAAEHSLDNTGVVILEGSGAGWNVVSWAGLPIGGAELLDSSSDPTGEPLSVAREN